MRMWEAARHIALLVASLVSLMFGLVDPVHTYVYVLVALGLLVLSVPRFDYRYPQSYSYYEHVYRKYAVRVLAVAYVLVVFIVNPSLESLALFVFVLTYSLTSFFVGASGLVASFLVLLGLGGVVLLMSRGSFVLHSLEETVFSVSMFLMFVLAPWFMAIYYVASKYYEMLYEYGRVSVRRLPLNLGVGVACTVFLIGAFVGGLFVALTKDPFFIVPVAFSGVCAGALIYDTFRKLRGKAWSYVSYADNFVDDAARILEEMLKKTGWGYEVKGIWRRKGVRVYVYSPFRAKITVREWVHRAYVDVSSVRIPVKTGSGTIIEVSPGPSRAPRALKEFMYRFLTALRLDREAAEWT